MIDSTRIGYDPRQHLLRSFFDAVPAFYSGQDSPRAYLERCLDTIRQREPEVKAFVVLNEAGARKAADAAGERYREGKPLSPIDGMPIGIKDLYETFDMPTQMGSELFRGWQSSRDGAPVRALRLSGAVILGKTVTTEFGFYNPGPTRNPFDITRTPGGSSSGSAAAVGAAMIPAAIGSQVVGSLIRPAGYCANFGFKPTFGALNRGGGGTGLSQAVIGVHAGTLEDAWAVGHQIASVVGGDPGHPGLYGEQRIADAVKPQRLIMLQTAGWSQCSRETQARLEDCVSRLSALGIEVLTREGNAAVADYENAIAEAKDVTHDICGYELRWSLGIDKERGPNALSEDISKRLEVWEKLTTEQYRRALKRRDELRQMHAALRATASALVSLSSAGAAPAGMLTGDPVFATPSSVLGSPALSLPLLEVEGMPLGLQLLGYTHADAELFGIGRWITAALRA